jgi:hypothetical protein
MLDGVLKTLPVESYVVLDIIFDSFLHLKYGSGFKIINNCLFFLKHQFFHGYLGFCGVDFP